MAADMKIKIVQNISMQKTNTTRKSNFSDVCFSNCDRKIKYLSGYNVAFGAIVNISPRKYSAEETALRKKYLSTDNIGNTKLHNVKMENAKQILDEISSDKDLLSDLLLAQNKIGLIPIHNADELTTELFLDATKGNPHLQKDMLATRGKHHVMLPIDGANIYKKNIILDTVLFLATQVPELNDKESFELLETYKPYMTPGMRLAHKILKERIRQKD